MSEKILLNIKDMEDIFGFKKSWIYAKVAAGELPQPINLGSTKRWHKDSVYEWLDRLRSNQ